MNDGNLLDPDQGDFFKELGMEAAWEAQKDKEGALKAMYVACYYNQPVLHDHLHEAIAALGVEVNRMAIGPLWKKAVDRGWIEQTPERTKTERPEANRRDGPVYESLIYRRHTR